MKRYLLTPGPTPIPENVSAALARPLIHHRTPEFQKLFWEIQDGLRALFQTRSDVLTLAATGTGAMDAAVCNLFRKGESVVAVNGGKFGERWTKLAEAYGLDAHELRVERGESLEPARLKEALRARPAVRGVLFQASETSTGALMPTRDIAAICREHGALSVCDAITACGVFELPMDAWGIDALITGSQKALMIPPGLSFIALGERAWAAQERSDLPRFYFDLARERKALAKGQTAWTPATAHVVALSESLRMLLAEGFPAVHARHALLAAATRAGVDALGLERLALRAPSPAVTAVRVPAQVADGKAIPRTMRDRYGVTIAGGQDELEGKIFRLSHFGHCDRFDVTTALSALELTLAGLGYPVHFGAGVGAALRVFSGDSPGADAGAGDSS